jgi:hypothetical protein
MRLVNCGFRPVVLGCCFLASAGCMEDNEAAIREQAAKAKNTIPGSRTAQAQTLDEYHEITPGLRGAGTRGGGPRPDQGKGYPEAKSATAASSLWRMAQPRTGQGTGQPVAKQ